MKPQVTAVPVAGVLGVPGRKHTIDEFYFLGAAVRGPFGARARRKIQAPGQKDGVSRLSGWIPFRI